MSVHVVPWCTVQVEYEAEGFLEKNNDSLPAAVVSLFQTSSNLLVCGS